MSDIKPELDRFLQRRERYYEELMRIRLTTEGLLEKLRSNGSLTLSEIALFEGLRDVRDRAFADYNVAEEAFAEALTRANQTSDPA